jgi:hypothetical protein
MSDEKTMSPAQTALMCQIAAGGLLLLAVALLAFNSEAVIQALFKGPPAVPLDKLDAAGRVEDVPYGRVKLVYHDATDLRLMGVRKEFGSNTAKVRYLAIRTGSKYFLAAVPPDHTEGPLYGGFYDWKGGIESQVREAAVKAHPHLRGKLQPFGFSVRVALTSHGSDMMVVAGLCIALAAGAWGFGYFVEAQAARLAAAAEPATTRAPVAPETATRPAGAIRQASS